MDQTKTDHPQQELVCELLTKFRNSTNEVVVSKAQKEVIAFLLGFLEEHQSPLKVFSLQLTKTLSRILKSVTSINHPKGIKTLQP